MMEDDLDIFNSLDNLLDKITFLNKVVFSDDNYDGLEWLFQYTQDDSSDQEDTSFKSLEEIKDITDVTSNDEDTLLSIDLYKLINNSDPFFIDLNDYEEMLIIIVGRKIYINFKNSEDLDDFKVKKLLYNDVIAVSDENQILPSYIKPYFEYKNHIILNVLGIIDNYFCMS